MTTLTLSKRSTRARRLQRALLLAFLAHLILALALPKLPKLIIPSIDRGRSITVFLRETTEPEVFEQSLEAPGLLNNQSIDSRPTAGANPSRAGDQEQNSEAATEVISERQDRSQTNPAGSESDAGLKPSVFILRSNLQVFAQQEAFQYADQNPDSLQRFERSFRSLANYRRRSRSDDYRDRYGDYYTRTSSSRGDICFKQEQVQQTDDFSTNTVMFFSCERGPIKLVLGNEQDEQIKDPVLPESNDSSLLPK